MTARGFRLVALSVVLGGTALLLSGCSWSEAVGLGWPNGITPEGKLNRELWISCVIASLVVGVIVWALIFWASFAYRKKTDELPKQIRYNLPIEILYTVVPFVIVGGLFYYTARDESKLDQKPKADMTVQVLSLIHI